MLISVHWRFGRISTDLHTHMHWTVLSLHVIRSTQKSIPFMEKKKKCRKWSSLERVSEHLTMYNVHIQNGGFYHVFPWRFPLTLLFYRYFSTDTPRCFQFVSILSVFLGSEIPTMFFRAFISLNHFPQPLTNK